MQTSVRWAASCGIKEVYPDIPETVYVAAKTMTLQSSMLNNRASAVCTCRWTACFSAALGQERYEADCMRDPADCNAMLSRELAPAFLR